MLKEFMQEIIETAEPKLIDVEGRNYSSKKIHPVPDPSPEALQIKTLTGFIDYIKNDLDALETALIMIHVEDHKTVRLISDLQGDFEIRHTYVNAVFEQNAFPYGRFMPVEEFIIAMQAHFMDTPDRAAILKLIGNVKEEIVRTTADDGVTQVVTAKTGIARVEDAVVPNPVTLKPFRTFLEVDQPESSFVFRMKSGGLNDMPSCALIEADGGKWCLDASLTIRDYLLEALPDIAIIA